MGMIEDMMDEANRHLKMSTMTAIPLRANAHRKIYDDMMDRVKKEAHAQAQQAYQDAMMYGVGTVKVGLSSQQLNILNQQQAQPPHNLFNKGLHTKPPKPNLQGLHAKSGTNSATATSGIDTKKGMTQQQIEEFVRQFGSPNFYSVDKNMNTIKPRTQMGRRILSTYLVYDTHKKKKYIAQRSAQLTTFEEVETDRLCTHYNYDGSERLAEVGGMNHISRLEYYISKGTYNEIELRAMILKAIKGRKKLFMEGKKGMVSLRQSYGLDGYLREQEIEQEPEPPDPLKVAKFKEICRKFDRCEKLVKMAYLDYGNINEANVAYKMLMREYKVIVQALMDVDRGEGE